MKVLWFTNDAVNLKENSFGGGWMQSLQAELSFDDDIELSIATRAKIPGIQQKDKLKKITKDKADYYLLSDRRSLFKKRMDLLFNREPHEENIKQYLEIINKTKPDIIHIFGSEMDYGLVSKFCDVPVILHIQGILTSCYYQLDKVQLPFFKAAMTNSLSDVIKGGTFGAIYRIFKQRTLVEKDIFKYCKHYIGRTDWDKKIMNILSPKSTYFHGEELLRDVFFKAKWKGYKYTDKTINVVSTISNPIYKGHETVIATCKVLKEAGFKFKWQIIGLDKTQRSFRIFYKKHLKELDGSIELLGNLNPSKMIPILESSDVYVHPSHIENSSNAICEAMAIGLPVIALHVGGNSSMIKHEYDGLLVPDNDPYILAANIVELKKNKEKSQKISINAKRRAENRHNPKQVIASLKDTYLQVINDHEIKK